MKTKLTVTIDRDLIPRAKERARVEGISLSRLIERALAALAMPERESFSQRWRGRFPLEALAAPLRLQHLAPRTAGPSA